MNKAIIIVLICVLLLSGCTSRGDDLQPSAPPVESSVPPESPISPPVQPTVDADVSTVKIELSTATVSISDLPMPVSYRLHNKSSKEITVEPYYEIERYDGSRWVSFPFSSDDPPNWPEGNIQLEPDASMDDSMSIWDFAEEITPGTYRIVKEVVADGQSPILIYAEFVVV